MQLLAKYFITMLQTRAAHVLPLIVLLSLSITAAAQTTANAERSVDDSSEAIGSRPVNTHPDSITSFEQFNMPLDMVMRFTQLTPEGMLMFHDEFQVMQDGLYGQEIMVIKIWYIDDHMIGYIIETPLQKTEGSRVRKSKINLPVTWCCRPTIEGHAEHCAKSLAEVKLDISSYKCIGWHIQMPPPLPPEPKIKLQKVKKPKKDKNGKKTAPETPNTP